MRGAGVDRSRERLSIAAPEAGLLTDADAAAALGMADDRNLTAHTYNESLAELIFSRLPRHLVLMERWQSEMARRASQ